MDEVGARAQVEVRPATADRFDDVVTLLGPREPDGPACWCLAYRCTSAENRLLVGGDRREHLRGLAQGDVPPGVLAYLDDEVVGWCDVGPRAEMGRLVRSRTIPPVDDVPVWSIVCLVVRPGFRRRGVTAALIAGAVGLAQTHGAPAVEAYPVDTEGGRVSGVLAFVGTTTMFERAGFERLGRTEARSAGLVRWVMRRGLSE